MEMPQIDNYGSQLGVVSSGGPRSSDQPVLVLTSSFAELCRLGQMVIAAPRDDADVTSQSNCIDFTLASTLLGPESDNGVLLMPSEQGVKYERSGNNSSLLPRYVHMYPYFVSSRTRSPVIITLLHGQLWYAVCRQECMRLLFRTPEVVLMEQRHETILLPGHYHHFTRSTSPTTVPHRTGLIEGWQSHIQPYGLRLPRLASKRVSRVEIRCTGHTSLSGDVSTLQLQSPPHRSIGGDLIRIMSCWPFVALRCFALHGSLL